MKNINYDLIKLLQCKMDNVWRVEKFYCSDAQAEHCQSESTLKKILDDEKRHIEMLIKEVKKRMDAGIFN